MNAEQPQYLAEIEITEYGEQPRYKIIGTYYVDDADELREALEAQGDYVLRVFAA